MSEWSSKFAGSIFDAHTHMGPFDTAENVLALQDAAGIAKTNLVSIQEWDTGLGLPQSLYMKAKYPERFTVFAGPNHAAHVSGGRVTTPSLVEQVDQFMDVGCDGIKMIESKPFRRQQLEVPLTDAYFADYWARIEELDIPMLWHVADPEEFWTPELLPPLGTGQGLGLRARRCEERGALRRGGCGAGGLPGAARHLRALLLPERRSAAHGQIPG